MINKLVFLFYTSFLNDWYPIRHNTKCNLTIYQINGKSYQNIVENILLFVKREHKDMYLQ